MTIIIFADDVVEVRVMELANTEATEAAAPLHPREMQEDADLQSKRSNNKQTVKCDICDKGFTSVSSRNKHLKSHFEGQYTCKHCGKVFTEIGNRNRLPTRRRWRPRRNQVPREEGKLWLLWRRREKKKRQNWLCLSQKFLLQQGNFLKT